MRNLKQKIDDIVLIPTLSLDELMKPLSDLTEQAFLVDAWASWVTPQLISVTIKNHLTNTDITSGVITREDLNKIGTHAFKRTSIAPNVIVFSVTGPTPWWGMD